MKNLYRHHVIFLSVCQKIFCGIFLLLPFLADAQTRIDKVLGGFNANATNTLFSLKTNPTFGVANLTAGAISNCSPISPCSGAGCPVSTVYPGTINPVASPINYRGTDAEFGVVVGGNFTIPIGGGAEIEGRTAVGGNFTMNNSYYGVGSSGGGTFVIAPDGEYNLVVRGNILRTPIPNGTVGNVQTTGTPLVTGKMIAGGSFAANVIGNNNTATYRIANAGTVAVDAILDIPALLSAWSTKSSCYAALATTGSFTGGKLVGDNSSPTQVFNLTAANVTTLSSQNLLFSNIPANAKIIINVAGTTINWNVANVAASIANHPTDYTSLGVTDPDVDVRNLVFNFYEATTLTLNNTLNGSVLVPNGNVDLNGSINGRVVIGGNLTHSGAGGEIHNYPFNSACDCVSPCVLTPTASTNSAICAGSTLTLTATGGTTYAWAGPAGFTSTSATPTRTNATAAMAGVYSVTVGNSPSCTATATTSVIINTVLVTADSNTPLCAGFTIALTATGGGTYLWAGPSGYSSNSASPTRNNATTAMDGIYSVTVTGTNNCSATTSISVIVNARPSITVSSNSPLCTGNTLTLTATGGNTYSWVGPSGFNSTSATPTQSNVTTGMGGIYSITVVGSNFCSATATISVAINATPTAFASGNIFCAGQTIALSATGGGTYAWSGPGGYASTAQNPTRSNATTGMSGTYSVTVNTNGCTASATATVVVNPKPSIIPTNQTICEGGTLILSATGGTNYLWGGPSGFSSIAVNPNLGKATAIMAGTYSVTVASGSGQSTCSASATLTVSVTPAPTTSTSVAFCPGGNATLSVSGGVSYLWSTTETTPSITVTTGGLYHVDIFDANGCKGVANFEVIVKPAPAINPSSNTPVCVGTQLLLSASGGGSYTWTGPSGFISTEQNPTRSAATTAMQGIYSVYVIGTNSCTNSATISVIINTQGVSATSISPVCEGSTITLSATPGANSYTWTGPNGFTSNISNPVRSNVTTTMGGIYSVTAQGGSGCSGTATVSVVVNGKPSATASSNTPVCAGNTLTLAATGGGTYSWAGPSGFSSTEQNPTRSNATTAMQGVYSVSVVGTNSCTNSATTSVTVGSASISATSNSPICKGLTINLSASGGGTYTWTGPGGFTASVQNPSQSDATTNMSGVYSVTVSSGNCIASATTNVLVTEQGATATSNSPVCGGNTISLSASAGGSSYLWTGPAGFTSAEQNPILTNATMAMKGTYSVTVQGSIGCSGIATVLVEVNALPTIDATSNAGVIANFCEGGLLMLTATGGGAYSWAGPNGFSSTSATPTRTNATSNMSGLYSVTITDINNCTASTNTSVTISVCCTVAATATANTVCAGNTLVLSATGGGTYAWAGPDGFTASSASPTRSATTTAMSGIYTVTVTANNSCTATATTSVLVKSVIVTATANGTVSEGALIQLTATGGGSYLWAGPVGFSSSSATPTRSNATTGMSGVYTVTVTGTNDCIGTATASVVVSNVPCNVSATASSNSPICSGQTLNLSASGGSTYLWAGPVGFSSTSATPTRSNTTTAMNGIYTVTASSGNSCTATATVSTTIFPTPSAIAVSNANTPICEGLPINLSAFGGTIYSWSGPAGFTSASQNPSRTAATPAMSGIYSVTVKGANTCTATATTSVIVTTCTATLGSIGDFVWKDQNKNGLQEAGEPGIKDIKVELYFVINDQVADTPTQTTFTNDNGYYSFTGLASAGYKVKFVKKSFPANASLTQANQGDDALDSDAESDGFSPLITIDANGTGLAKNNPTIDAGLVVLEYDLTLDKSIEGPTLYEIGETVTYVIKVKNEGEFKVANVKVIDILPDGVSYVSSLATKGSFSDMTHLWTIGDVAVGETVNLTIKVKVTQEGVWFNTAEVYEMDGLDIDSTPNNGIETEDDIDRVCFTVPFRLCSGSGEQIKVQLPDGLSGIQWYKDGKILENETQNALIISKAGSYTFTATKSFCPDGGCCPVEVKYVDCCKKDSCVPFLITQTK